MNKIFLLILFSFFLLLALNSCKTSNKLIYLENKAVDYIVDDTVFFYKKNPVEYKINKNDILMIRFASTNEEVTKYFESFSGVNNANYYTSNNQNLVGINVNDSGFIDIPIIGKFYVEGYTLSELQKALQVQADKYLINSRIIVKLLNYKITFLGEVAQQGVLQVQENQITLIEAIAQMGGISDFGNRKNILIMRTTPFGYQTYRVDITDRALIEKKEFFLLPNDIIIVEPRPYKVLSSNLREYTTLITSVASIITSITLIFSLNNNGN